MNKRWHVGLLNTVLILGILMVGCTCPIPEAVKVEPVEPTESLTALPTFAPVAAPVREPVTLRMGLPYESTLDPAFAVDEIAMSVVQQLFLNLVDTDENGGPIPELATDWSVTDNGLTWTFHLRKDVTWVNSEGLPQAPVTAHDVVYAIRRAVDPETGADAAWLLYGIENAEAANAGEAAVEEIGVRAPDDYTVEFTLKEPAAYFPAILAMPVANPVPSEPIEEHGEAWTEPENIWTNGPYLLAEWIHGDSIRLEQNPEWWGAGDMQVVGVHVTIMGSYETTVAMYESGLVDHVQIPHTLFSLFWPELTENETLSQDIQMPLQPQTYVYGFTTTKPPFDDELVRRAFALATDRYLLCEGILGWGMPATSLVPPGVLGSAPVEGLAFDPELARQSLADAGYPGGAGFPVVTLMYNSEHEYHRHMAETLASGWEANLGVRVEAVGVEWQDYRKVFQKDTPLDEMPHIWRLAWEGSYPDADDWLFGGFHSTEGTNYVRWSNPEFDQLTEAAREERNPDARAEIYGQAEEILLVEEAAIIPVCHYPRVYLSKPYVKPTYSLQFGLGDIASWEVDSVARAEAIAAAPTPTPAPTSTPVPLVGHLSRLSPFLANRV